MKKIILILILMIYSGISAKAYEEFQLPAGAENYLLSEQDLACVPGVFDSGLITSALDGSFTDELTSGLISGKSLLFDDNINDDNINKNITIESQGQNLFAGLNVNNSNCFMFFDYINFKYINNGMWYKGKIESGGEISKYIYKVEKRGNQVPSIVINNKAPMAEEKTAGDAQVEFNLQNPSNVSVELFNMLGKSVLEIISNQHYERGEHHLIFDKEKIPNGAYYVKIRIDNDIINKLIVIT